MRITLLHISTILVGCSVACSSPPPLKLGPPSGDPTRFHFPSAQVSTPTGAVQGEIHSTVKIYRGVPYAESTSGSRRWKEPEPKRAWTGVIDATKNPPACPQLPVQGDLIGKPPPVEQSEDCLTVTIYSPAETATEHLPVMMWIHGGWFENGSSALYAGENLAKKGHVVVVGVNYRLGVFGFMAHPLLKLESVHHSEGNYGLLDQIEALKWIHSNIQSFGGDPNKITVFGQSAGAWSACDLYVSPLTTGLLSGAIMESGRCDRELAPAAKLENMGKTVAKKMGCENAPDPLSCLRTKSTAEILNALPPGDGYNSHTHYSPIADGYVLPDTPDALLTSRNKNLVPLILGYTAQETSRYSGAMNIKTKSKLVAYLKKTWPAVSNEIIKIYHVNETKDVTSTFDAILTDRHYACPIIRTAQKLAHANKKVYLYRFSYVPYFGKTTGLGAYHAAEIPYVFGNLMNTKARKYGLDDHVLSAQMISFWSSFAALGSPDTSERPTWKPMSSAEGNLIDFEKKAVPRRLPDSNECRIWDRIGSL